MWTVMSSPVGDLRIVEHNGAITAIEFTPFAAQADGRPRGARDDADPVLVEAVAQLTAYFARERRELRPSAGPRGHRLPAAGVGPAASGSATARPRRTARSPTGSG